MRGSGKRVLIAVGLAVVVAVLQLFYWVSATAIADRWIIEFDGLYWRTSPQGTLFPWPRESGMLQALSPVGPTDQMIYYMIRSNLYILLTAVLTLLAAALGHLSGGALSH